MNEECLNHLNSIGQIYLEHYLYNYIEIQIWKSIHLPKFESPPENQWSEISFPTFNTSTLEFVNRNLNIYPNKYNLKRTVRKNLNIFDLLSSTEMGND